MPDGETEACGGLAAIAENLVERERKFSFFAVDDDAEACGFDPPDDA